MTECRGNVALCRHTGNGAVIARCSQPEVGWLGWRSSADEDLLKAIADACAYDRGQCTMMDRSSAGLSHSKKTESETDGSVGKVCGSGNVAYLSLNSFHMYSINLESQLHLMM